MNKMRMVEGGKGALCRMDQIWQDPFPFALMRRHQPTLFTLQEQDADEAAKQKWDHQHSRSSGSTPASPPATSPSMSTTAATPSTPLAPHAASTSTPSLRSKTRAGKSFTSQGIVDSTFQSVSAHEKANANYSDLYSQFVRRYRSSGLEDDPRNDPDSYYYYRGLGQLNDSIDTDDDEVSSLSSNLDAIDHLLLEGDDIDPDNAFERERFEWQVLLASVLGGEVLNAEKTRISVALEMSVEDRNSTHTNIWVGLRSRMHGRTLADERKSLEEKRLRIVDAVLEEIKSFRVVADGDPESITAAAFRQVLAMLHKFDVAQSLYPSLKALYMDKPVAAEPEFQARLEALNTWSNVLSRLRRQIDGLRRWTGSDTLDVDQPNTSREEPLVGATTELANGNKEIADNTSFVERVLKEESTQRTFEKGFLTTIHSFISLARDDQVNLAPLFAQMNLPTFEQELKPLISFPTKLAQAALRVRLDYVRKIQEHPEVLIIDQMTEDLKLSIGLACTLKRQYQEFLVPDPELRWQLDPCISEDYDHTILEALSEFFKLIHWKLKSGVKAIYFKETDVLESQWATFNDVSSTVTGGSCLVAEQLCALTNKLMVRVTNYFETQVRVPVAEEKRNMPLPRSEAEERVLYSAVRSAFQAHLQSGNHKMSDEQVISWYGKILDSVRLRYRKLQRFARVLTQRFNNSAEYIIDPDNGLEELINVLIASGHTLLLTKDYELEGTYIVVPMELHDRPDEIGRILTEAFHLDDSPNADLTGLTGGGDYGDGEEPERAAYVLLLSPRSQFMWHGNVLPLKLPRVDFDIDDERVRLIAAGPQRRLSLARETFEDYFLSVDDDGHVFEEDGLGPLTCAVEAQAHLPRVNRELRKITRVTNRLAESIVDSVHHVRESLRGTTGCQELLENWYMFASDHGQQALKYMDNLKKLNRLLIKLAISWVSFICDDCDHSDRRTFKWAVMALEFTFQKTKRNNILSVPDEEFRLLRTNVASCMTLLVSHFDILGARSAIDEKKERERQIEMLRLQASAELGPDEEELAAVPQDGEDVFAFTDHRTRMFWEKIARRLRAEEARRAEVQKQSHLAGRVLDDEKPEDRSLVFLANSSSMVAFRWQQGAFVGAGAFGSVYRALNLDDGRLMAVKEIRLRELSGVPNLHEAIAQELKVMEGLQHPNIVQYYGIEVHRDKVYIFEEFCQGGSLASLLEHGPIEDERIIQLYTMQMLEGLEYLHSRNVSHRDVKPDNILLDHHGVIKFVDFGAAKTIVQNQRSMQRSRRVAIGMMGPNEMNSLTGTPMYMAPEVIKNIKTPHLVGTMDIWALGCVVLEFATGKKPWSNLDNEWAIMFHIGVATQHPPLPEPGQLSDLGIHFIKQCLIIDPARRPIAADLLSHAWILDLKAELARYQEEEVGLDEPSLSAPEGFENTAVARQAAMMQEEETAIMKAPTPILSPVGSTVGTDESPGLTSPDTSPQTGSPPAGSKVPTDALESDQTRP
ncbi:hypothetical protein HGRIS_007513 [Hohenbuehelia grisea]|uniref:Protein kinase domain-containing protein n=1 Tax=Hohenbuehelia grisea TaxID=104357 RepID=A0ABR3J535_9AGAR